MNTAEKISPFRFLWYEVRDYYAPTTTAPAATAKAMEFMSRSGYEVLPMTRTSFLIDGELFEIKKVKGHSHFDLIQHGVQI